MSDCKLHNLQFVRFVWFAISRGDDAAEADEDHESLAPKPLFLLLDNQVGVVWPF